MPGGCSGQHAHNHLVLAQTEEMKPYIFAACLLITLSLQSQSFSKLDAAWRSFEQDPQLRFALAGMCVLDAGTGNMLWQRNAYLPFAPASTQKVLTSIAAFEALGQSFRYSTRLGYTGQIRNRILHGNLIVEATGDPTLASTNYATTRDTAVLARILAALRQTGIDSINGNLVCSAPGMALNPMPDGWTWGDMGNYYGAGHWALNWQDNAWNAYFTTPSTPGNPVTLKRNAQASMPLDVLVNDVVSGKKGTGDGSVIYAGPLDNKALIQGKLEPGESAFRVGGAIPQADLYALRMIRAHLQSNHIGMSGQLVTPLMAKTENMATPANMSAISNITSPALDSLVYWFMRKSINLYGEALLKTIGLNKKQTGSTAAGLEWVDSFYLANGIDKDALHITDGSGLSPANRVVPAALAKALYYARSRPWYPAFYESFPLYNNMKLKSGTISRTKCFAGYVKNYVVVIMVNNYNGNPGALVSKMYGVLNELM
jgi:D-alanyl-D-alanine carboxypeptidase/D-alanyl-D-alanine-endopeptidase (penicillin-binding protein 4)